MSVTDSITSEPRRFSVRLLRPLWIEVATISKQRTEFHRCLTKERRKLMPHRTCILLGIVGSLMVLISGPIAAEDSDSKAKPKVTKSDIEAMMKSLSNWGRWGADDELGTLNLITPAKRKQAAALVRDGVTVSLAHDASTTANGSSSAFGHKMIALPQNMDFTGASDEYRVAYHGFMETHLDSLCHMAYKGRM